MVGIEVGFEVGVEVGLDDGYFVGLVDGEEVGIADGKLVGFEVGICVGIVVGFDVGFTDGDIVGFGVEHDNDMLNVPNTPSVPVKLNLYCPAGKSFTCNIGGGPANINDAVSIII